MIRVTIELLPGGNQARARTICIMEVANLVTHPDDTADYAITLRKTPPFSGALRLLEACGLGQRNKASVR